VDPNCNSDSEVFIDEVCTSLLQVIIDVSVVLELKEISVVDLDPNSDSGVLIDEVSTSLSQVVIKFSVGLELNEFF
jgi:hypothetical protein